MTQHQLYTLADVQPSHLARAEHPATSREAAESIVADGTLMRMAALALAVLRSHPGATGRELDRFAGTTDGAVRKRLDGLRKDGLARNGEPRRCEVSGHAAQTWYATEGK